MGEDEKDIEKKECNDNTEVIPKVSKIVIDEEKGIVRLTINKEKGANNNDQ